MRIKWSESMSTGVSIIDEQHKDLIDSLNSLSQAITEGKGRDIIAGILEFAEEYAGMHFRLEEEYFEKYKCPAAVLNIEGHKYFINRFLDLKEEFLKKGSHSLLVIEIHKELLHWIIQHILKVDTRLHVCIKEEP
ncbi:MAG: hemerythrin family protein [Planctomycetes bacterium]|nr:hemerythrin family protein [Planctomycetota bacterium]